MECAEIKQIIPQYFQHTAGEEEIQAVEEHLCVCHDCRTLLGELMDKASSAEEAAEAPSQEQAEPLTDEKSQEETEEKEEVSEPILEKKEEEVPASSEKKEDMEYFSGEGLEASMDKANEILGGTEPAKGDPGEEPQALEEKEEEKKEAPDISSEEKADKEGSSFEVIMDIPSAPKQELPAESDTETLGGKEPEPVKEEIKEPEEKLEVSPEEEVSTKEEIKELQAEPVLKREEEQPEEVLRSEKSERDESEGEKESLEGVSYTLDGFPLEKGKIGLLECFCLIGGLAVLGFLAYLFLKG